MASGITSGWGYSIEQVGGLRPRMERGKHLLIYENNLVSYPPTFVNNKFTSPLTLANESFYHKKGNAYGSSNSRSMCEQFLKNKKFNPITGRPIQPNGAIYNLFMNKCKEIASTNLPVKSSGPIEGTFGRIKYTLYPKHFILINGKELKIGSKINGFTITNIGPKRILVRDNTFKERRIKVTDFIKLV